VTEGRYRTQASVRGSVLPQKPQPSLAARPASDSDSSVQTIINIILRINGTLANHSTGIEFPESRCSFFGTTDAVTGGGCLKITASRKLFYGNGDTIGIHSPHNSSSFKLQAKDIIRRIKSPTTQNTTCAALYDGILIKTKLQQAVTDTHIGCRGAAITRGQCMGEARSESTRSIC
jgi:hypothetical protein